MPDKFEGLRKAVRVGYQVSTDESRALLEAYDALVAPQAEPAKAHAFFRSSGIIRDHRRARRADAGVRRAINDRCADGSRHGLG